MHTLAAFQRARDYFKVVFSNVIFLNFAELK
jgi:hypothetical protein